MSRPLHLFTGLALAILVVGSGCTANRPVGNPEAPYPPPRPPQVGDILHIPTGYYIDQQQLFAAVGETRIVYVGETHDNPASHRLQLDLLRAMAERSPGRVALAMEMFTPSQQAALDRWSAGELSEKEFLRQAGWNQVWRMDFAYYRDLLHYARERRIPVLGINADKALVKQVGRQEFEQLPPESQAALPTIDRGDPYHQALIKAIFGDHDQGKNRLAGFQRVQLLWDETMAENIARYLTSPAGENRRLLVVAGGNHIRNGFGIPRRVYRRVPSSHVLIATREIEIDDDKKDRLMDVTFPVFPMPAFDYLVFSKYESLDNKEVKLGALLDDGNRQVVVKGVRPGSNAERAGLREGDVIVSFAGIPVADSYDLVYEIQHLKPGEQRGLDVLRGTDRLSLTVDFQTAGKPDAGSR